MTDARQLIGPLRDFLSAPRCAVLSTLGPDGAPRQIVIHYMLGEEHVRLNGHRDRRWVANVRRDPRVALVVHDDRDYLHYVSIRGRAVLIDEGEDALAEAMTQAVAATTRAISAAKPASTKVSPALWYCGFACAAGELAAGPVKKFSEMTTAGYPCAWNGA